MSAPTPRPVLEERRDRALDDLIELRRQIEAGEIDPDHASELEQRYEAEAADALRALDESGRQAPQRRNWRRAVAGVAIFAVLGAGVVVALVTTVDGDGSQTATTRDLSAVTNEEMEQVVADNPDIVPMRLALARRYVEEGDFSAALPHYLYILEREDNAEAFMYLGWMTYLSGDPATAETLLVRSLAVAPGDPVASWFLANTRFYGLDDKEGAIDLLETVLASDEAPLDITAEAQRMLDEARG